LGPEREALLVTTSRKGAEGEVEGAKDDMPNVIVFRIAQSV
jgi:hypothetical protein